jgi:hypothetical protein
MARQENKINTHEDFRPEHQEQKTDRFLIDENYFNRGLNKVNTNNRILLRRSRFRKVKNAACPLKPDQQIVFRAEKYHHDPKNYPRFF